MLMLCGMIFTFFFGWLLHFAYEWSGRSIWIAFIAPTNESYFEHLKLLLTPFLLWTLVEYAHYGQYMHAFIPAKVIALYVGMLLIVGLHLLYIGIWEKPIRAFDIAIFAFAVFVAFVLGEFLMTLVFMDSSALEILFDGILVLTVLVFVVFTIYAPHHWLFRPPGAGK